MATSSTIQKSKSEKLVVAAIDFGTTYSGYAFALRHDFEAEPPKVSANTNWVGGGQLISLKTPTILLLDENEKFVAFGYEAEDQYGQLAADNEHDKYYYFRRFKMKLYNSMHLKRDTMMEDDRGKKLNAIKVFSICIKYLMDHFMKTIKNRVNQIKDSDVSWVLTVPAIWNDGSKQFMREAAEMAGIKKDALIIALEPEAASLFCMHLPVEQLHVSGANLNQSQMSPFSNGTRYMVVDVGGGTVDITVHEVVDKGKLKELNWASGGAWGGTRVDAAFENFIEKIFSKEVFEAFKKECVEDWVDLQRQFETKKRSIKVDKQGKETLNIPMALVETYKKKTGKEAESAVKENKEYAGQLAWTAGKMRVDCEVMKGWFKESCDNTVKHVRNLFNEKESAGTKTILLVGGFSESALLQEALRNNFRDKRLIVPDEAGLAVLKGAVIFGHDPVTIISRVAKCSYGVRVFRDFVDGQHPRDKRQEVNGRVKCKDVFAKHVTKGQELVVNTPQSSQRYTPLEADQVSLIFDVYTSPEKDPRFVTDRGSIYVGQLEVDVPDYGKDRGVWVNMIFGGTEVVVKAQDERTQKVTQAKFNFLQ